MNFRILNNNDQEALQTLLKKFASTSLFMLSNIEQTQINYSGAMFEGRYYGAFDGAQLIAVLVQYWNGNLMFQGDADAIEELWVRFGTEFAKINGFIGREDLCQLLKAKYDQQPNARAYSISSKERLYELDLTALQTPTLINEHHIQWRLATLDDLEYLVPWMVDYNIEALGAVKNEALVEETTQSTLSKINNQMTFVITHNDEPVATASYNAKTHPFVQIGAVWTPIQLRGRGYAQCAVAAALITAREDGFSRSILFTDEQNIAAQKAYEKIGYQSCGDFGLYILTD